MFPFSDEPQELEGVAHRGDFDLKAHGKPVEEGGSGKELSYFDEEGWNARSQRAAHAVRRRQSDNAKEEKKKLEQEEKPKFQFVPHVIELESPGPTGFTLAVLCEAYPRGQAARREGERWKSAS